MTDRWKGARVRRRNYGSGHGYETVGPAPARLIGTTYAVGLVGDSGGLIDWSAKEAGRYVYRHHDVVTAMIEAGDDEERVVKHIASARNQTLGRASKRGTDIHGIAEQLNRGDEVDVPEHLLGPVDAYLAFLAAFDVTVVLAEAPVFHLSYGYAGTLDIVADLLGERWLLDIKTSAGPPRHEVVLQLAAYANAEFYLDADAEEQPMPAVDRYGVVWLTEDSYELVPYRNHPDDFYVFLNAVQVARWQRKGTKRFADGPMWTASGPFVAPPGATPSTEGTE